MIKQTTIASLTFGPWETGIVIDNSDGFDFPVPRVDIKNFGNADGAKLGSALYGSRKMALEGRIIGDDPADFELKRRQLQSALNIRKGLQRATFVTRGGLTVRADVISTNRLGMAYTKGSMIICDFRLELEAPFPFLLGNTVKVKKITAGSGGGGAVPSAIPFALTGVDDSQNTVENLGNVEAWFKARIYGPITNPVLKNSTTDEQWSLTYDLATANDYVDMDFRLHTVKLNNNLNIYQYHSGDWWKIIEGVNYLKLLGSALNGGYAEITYQDHYLGI